jgi:peroxiredoxin Q/BCP
LSDVDRKVAEAYGTAPEPDAKWPVAKRHTFLIDPDGRIAKLYDVRDIPRHPAEVFNDIREMQGA